VKSQATGATRDGLDAFDKKIEAAFNRRLRRLQVSAPPRRFSRLRPRARLRVGVAVEAGAVVRPVDSAVR
jgi:hypothetical protein